MHLRRIAILIASGLSLPLTGLSQEEPTKDRFVTLEGELVQAKLASIDASGLVALEDSPQKWALEDLRSITPSHASFDKLSERGSQTLMLACGSALVGENLTMKDDRLHLTFAEDAFSISIDAARGLRFEAPQPDSRFEKALTAIDRDRDEDRLFLTGTGANEMQEITGLITQFDDKSLTIDLQGEQRILPMENIHGALLATPLLSDDDREIAEIHLTNGSLVVSEIRSLEDNVLDLLLIDSTPLTLDWESVNRVTIRSALLVYLSDLEPTEVQQEAILALPRDWKRDRNILGSTLRIGDLSFDKGLGTAAGHSLTFSNSEDYDLFTAMIGIDSGRGTHGDCVFVVLGDGEELARERVRGGEDPKTLRAETKGYESITLSVEPGEGLIDLADDANWADACFLTLKER